MLSYTKPFILFSNIIMSRGFSRSLLADLQRHKYFLIPNDLYDILYENKGNNLSKVLAEFEKNDKLVIEDYFNFLYKNELIFFSDHIDGFPPLITEWQDPSIINNSILAIGENYRSFNYEQIIKNLSDLGCQALELRIFGDIDNLYLKSIIKFSKDNIIRDLVININNSDKRNVDFYKDLYQINHCISQIKIFSSKRDEVIDAFDLGQHPIIFLKSSNFSNHHCGLINPDFFTVNIKLFTEGINHNTCLNKKISIDEGGNIKNCPSMQESFGNIKNTTLNEVISKPQFKKLWNITKNEIEICKECEFRNICTDCRAYLDTPNDTYSKPLKCGYNPKTNEWQDWSKNPLKITAMKHYKMENLMKA